MVFNTIQRHVSFNFRNPFWLVNHFRVKLGCIKLLKPNKRSFALMSRSPWKCLIGWKTKRAYIHAHHAVPWCTAAHNQCVCFFLHLKEKGGTSAQVLVFPICTAYGYEFKQSFAFYDSHTMTNMKIT